MHRPQAVKSGWKNESKGVKDKEKVNKLLLRLASRLMCPMVLYVSYLGTNLALISPSCQFKKESRISYKIYNVHKVKNKNNYWREVSFAYYWDLKGLYKKYTI